MKNRSLNPLQSAALQFWAFMCACGVAARRNSFALLCACALAFGLFAPTTAHAALADLVTYTQASGEVNFSPGNLAGPIVTGAIAAAIAAASLFLLVVGIRWVYRMLKGAK